MLDLLNRLRTKYHGVVKRRPGKGVTRRQFNMTVDVDMIHAIKALAAILEVPKYVVTEHALQVGCRHLVDMLQEPETRQKLHEHLVKVHLLGGEVEDDEDIIEPGQRPQ